MQFLKEFIDKKVNVIAFSIDETEINVDKTFTHFANEDILSKDWLSKVEDVAWQNL